MAGPSMDVTLADVYEFLEASADADDPSFAELLTERMASKAVASEPSAQDAGPPSLSHQGPLDGVGADSMLSSRLDSPSLSLPHLQPWNNPAVSQLPTLCSAPSPAGAQLASPRALPPRALRPSLRSHRRTRTLPQGFKAPQPRGQRRGQRFLLLGAGLRVRRRFLLKRHASSRAYWTSRR